MTTWHDPLANRTDEGAPVVDAAELHVALAELREREQRETFGPSFAELDAQEVTGELDDPESSTIDHPFGSGEAVLAVKAQRDAYITRVIAAWTEAQAALERLPLVFEQLDTEDYASARWNLEHGVKAGLERVIAELRGKS